MNKLGKLLLLTLCITVIMVIFAVPGFASYASKVNSFIADSRWSDGVAWGDNQQPKMPGNNQFWGCAAYACDFTRYVWGASSYHDGSLFYDYTQIRDGDVIHTGGHYYVVLQRSGNTLWTAEGNYTSSGYAHVWITTSHYNAGSASGCSFSQGWHNPNYEAYVNSAYLDVNGYLDGELGGGLGTYGTCDVYINGSRVADDVSDYCVEWTAGTTYSIQDIKANANYKYEGVKSGALSGTIGSTRIDVVLSFTSYATLDVKGLLDKVTSENTNGFGTFDVYINGGIDAVNVSDYNRKWPQGTTYEIKNINPVEGKYYNGATTGMLSGKLGKGTTTVTLSMSTMVQAGSDWREDSALPGYIDPDTVEIQYKHHYEKTSTASPGTGWSQVSGSGVTTYVNDGGVYESDFELTPSNTCVHVGTYYYHYCASGATDVEHYNDGYHTVYHNVGDINQFYTDWEGPDSADSRYTAYRIKWVSGQWANGYAYCELGSPAVYYRRYQYQNRKAVTNYKWVKDSDWVATPDSTATSTTVRFRLKRYDVVFDANGGENVPESQVKFHDIDLEMTGLLATRSGFTFVGWNTRADGSGTAYDLDSVYADNANVLLFAQWQPATRLTLPANVTTIEEHAFEGIGAVIIEVPDGCVSIGEQAFLNCSELVQLYIPASVKSISFDAFDGCVNVTIFAPEGSTALRLAKALGIPYEVVE